MRKTGLLILLGLGILLNLNCSSNSSPTSNGNGGKAGPTNTPTATVVLTYSYESAFGQQGNGSNNGSNGYFSIPYGVAVSPDGSLIAVSDIGYSNIQVFNSSGVYLYQINSTNSGNPNSPAVPNGMVIDENKNLYVADSGTTEVDVYSLTNSSGTWKNYFVGNKSNVASFQGPQDVKFDNKGNLVVADNNGTSGSTYNVDFANDNVISTSSGDGGGLQPTGLTVDSTGNIYVSDARYDAIIVYNSNLQYIYSFNGYGGPDSGAPAWANGLGIPFGIVVDSEGYLVIADNAGGQAVRTTIYGLYNQNIGVGEVQQPNYIGMDPSGDLFITDSQDYQVLKFKP